jgi:mono/diheme cytochrome c family protein
MLGKNNRTAMKLFIAGLAALTVLAPLAKSEDAFDLKASIDRGKMIYMQTCIACHQPTGLGLPPVFPPLAGSEYTQGDARRMVAMTLKGVNPPLKVKEATYAGVAMLPLPTQFPMFADDAKLADVINYVRNSFGNKDETGVTPAMIDATRKEFADRTAPWTEPELLKFPEPKK